MSFSGSLTVTSLKAAQSIDGHKPNKGFPYFPVNLFIQQAVRNRRRRMGGAKKKSMAQMERTQDQTDKKDEPGSKKGKAKTVVEKRPRGLQSPDLSDPKFLAEVQKMGAITPFSIASQFNLRLSVAKDLLEDL